MAPAGQSFFCQGLQRIRWGPPTFRRAICFLPSLPVFMLISPKTPAQVTRLQSDTWPVKRTHEMSHHRYPHSSGVLGGRASSLALFIYPSFSPCEAAVSRSREGPKRKLTIASGYCCLNLQGLFAVPELRLPWVNVLNSFIKGVASCGQVEAERYNSRQCGCGLFGIWTFCKDFFISNISKWKYLPE